MRLDDLPESGNVEDRREGGFGGGGGGFGIPIGGGGLSIGAIVALGLIGWALGIDPSLLIGGAEVLNRPSQPQVQAPPTARRTTAPQDETGRFVSKVLGSTELQWKQVFAKEGRAYRPPVLVLYRGATQASCGGEARSAMGPFYCPADQKVYLDTAFFDQIATRFRGCDVGSKTCQFSQAYVIAHEVGHHVQNLLGILPKAQHAQRAADSEEEGMAVREATLEETPYGRYVTSDGWFVVNLADALAVRMERGGAMYPLETPDSPFADFGARVVVLWPADPNALYHAEGVQ